MAHSSTPIDVDRWSLDHLTRVLHYALPPIPDNGDRDEAAVEAVRQDIRRLLEEPRTRAAVVALLRLRCRDWWLRACASLAALGAGASYVEARTDLSREEFLGRYYIANRPVFLPGLARDWPAFSRWNAEYLSQITASVEVMFNREEARVHERSIPSRFVRTMPFPEFVQLVYSGRSTNDYYLVGKNCFFDRPDTQRLLDDIVCPPFMMIGEGAKKVGMWFGPAGTHTPIHYDGMNNVLVQIVGRKVFRLYSPFFSECMEQRQQWHGDVDPATADPHRHPAASRAACAVVTLNPGDALFVPVGWWHVVEALDVSISLSFKEFGVLNDFGSAFVDAPRRDTA